MGDVEKCNGGGEGSDRSLQLGDSPEQAAAMAGRGLTARITATSALLLALSLLSFVSPLTALYNAESGVFELTEKNFDAEVMESSDSLWLVEFYAPWCSPTLPACTTHNTLHGCRCCLEHCDADRCTVGCAVVQIEAQLAEPKPFEVALVRHSGPAGL
jgi:hypothetical protein